IMVLVDEEGGTNSFIGTLMNDTIMVFVVDGLEEGDCSVSFNGTSATGDPLEGDKTFLVRIGLKETDPPSSNDNALPIWLVLSVVILMMAALAALALILFFRNRKRSMAAEMGGSGPKDEQAEPSPLHSPVEEERKDLIS
ncbi:MAG: hypothetical protein ACMUFK_01655, partial [Thermoplasmatota archaeon]